MNLVIFLLTCIGATYIITMSEIFKPLRTLANKIHTKLGYLFQCSLCLGFWVGLIVGLAFPSLCINPLLGGFMSSTASFFYYVYIEYLYSRIGQGGHNANS